jgi:hypothetical protein
LSTPQNVPPMILTDGSNDFAHNTMAVRVPETLADIQERNPDYPRSVHAALDNLSRSIQNDEPILMLPSFAPDYAVWLPAWEAHRGHTWLNTDWFFAEKYFYRQVIECVRWWETGRDPFLPHKIEEYASDALWSLLGIALEVEGTAAERLADAISRALWGNRIDLSFAASLERGTHVNDDDLLADDTEHVVEHLLGKPGAVHIIADNAGTELAMDLALVDVLLDGIADSVVMHLKFHPTFVSDTTPADVWNFFDALNERGGVFAGLSSRLQSAIFDQRLRLIPDLYWNSSRLLWDLPPNLVEVFQASRLVVVKGDVNYRRMVGDAIWPEDTPLAEAVSYFPAPILALRTMKSDPVVGLTADVVARLNGFDNQWRVNGQRGLIQYAKPG